MEKERNNSFRWSFDEVKYLFRGSNRSQRSQANSGKIFRFSFDDIRRNFWSRGSSARASEKKQARNKKKRGAARSQDKDQLGFVGSDASEAAHSNGSGRAAAAAAAPAPAGKRRRKKLTPEERERRRQQREFDRRDKKSVRERERREHVGSLFGTLSNMLNVHTDTKDKTKVLEQAVAKVKAAKYKNKRANTRGGDTVMTPAGAAPSHRGRSRVAKRGNTGGGGADSRLHHSPVDGPGPGSMGSHNQTMGVNLSPRRGQQLSDQQRAFLRNDRF